MEEGLIYLLLSSAGVGNRVYPGTRPQASALPAIVLNTISSTPSYSDDGEDGIREDRVQIDCWGSTYASAKSVARAVTTALSAYRGTVDDVTFQYITLDLQHDFRESGSNAAEYLFRTSLDFLVTYS